MSGKSNGKSNGKAKRTEPGNKANDPGGRDGVSKSSKRTTPRLWFFRLATACLAPLLVLGGLESALRLGGFGYPTDFFVASDDGEHWVENPHFAWQFYSPSSRLMPHPFRLKREKAEGTIRIFVLGGSTALGTPESAYGFVRVLERMLQIRFPDRSFEVVNAAMPGINSHLIQAIARNCAELEPDLFVVYAGNNELVGLHAPGPDSKGFADSLPLLRLAQWVRSSRTGQWLAPQLQFLAPSQPDGEQDMDFFRRHQLGVRDPGRERVARHFRANLTDVLDVARGAGAKTILSTVAVNDVDCPPLGSLHRVGLSDEARQQWEVAFEKGNQHELAGDFELAVLAYREAQAIDSDYAELAFRRARCFAALGKTDEARKAYVAARDLDSLPFRCTSRLNEVIRELAQEREGAELVFLKSDRLLAASAPGDIRLAGEETFYEHVHFRFLGDYRMARLIFRETLSLLSEELGIEGDTFVESPSEAEVAASLAYTRVSEGRLESSIMDMTSNAPFLDQLDHEERKLAAKTRLKQRFGSLNSEDVAEAFRTFQMAMDQYPDDWNLPYLLARLHFTFHNFEAARENLGRTVKLMPHVLEVRLGYTRALIETKQFEEAFRQIDILDVMAPGSAAVESARSTAKARQAANR